MSQTKPRAMSEPEARFLQCWTAISGRVLVSEYQFHETRKWRLDFAAGPERIAFEIDGGVFSAGRHTRGAGYTEDCRKMNAAAMLGWRVFRLTPDMIQPSYLEEIRKATGL